VPKQHPLRAIKKLVEIALSDLGPAFEQMYASIGRPSIPPERLLKATLLMAFYSVRSERLFLERTQLAGYLVGAAYNLLRMAKLLAA